MVNQLTFSVSLRRRRRYNGRIHGLTAFRDSFVAVTGRTEPESRTNASFVSLRLVSTPFALRLPLPVEGAAAKALPISVAGRAGKGASCRFE